MLHVLTHSFPTRRSSELERTIAEHPDRAGLGLPARNQFRDDASRQTGPGSAAIYADILGPIGFEEITIDRDHVLFRGRIAMLGSHPVIDGNTLDPSHARYGNGFQLTARSEERRVGKECCRRCRYRG